MTDDIVSLVNLFEPITLSEMDSVKLMDRRDTKYVFHIQNLPAVLMDMKDHYRILEINNVRMHVYKSLYFDTPDFSLFLQHQREKMNRHKIRYRTYVDSGLSYFEIKFKNNKGRTIKKRVKVDEIPKIIQGKAEKLLNEITEINSQSLEPKLWVNCVRMTFVGIHSTERITIDTGLKYIKSDTDECFEYSDMVIAEVKQDKTNHDSPFIRAVRKKSLRKASISKYCFGVYQMIENIKKNNFKQKVRFVNKCISQ